MILNEKVYQIEFDLRFDLDSNFGSVLALIACRHLTKEVCNGGVACSLLKLDGGYKIPYTWPDPLIRWQVQLGHQGWERNFVHFQHRICRPLGNHWPFHFQNLKWPKDIGDERNVIDFMPLTKKKNAKRLEPLGYN